MDLYSINSIDSIAIGEYQIDNLKSLIRSFFIDCSIFPYEYKNKDDMAKLYYKLFKLYYNGVIYNNNTIGFISRNQKSIFRWMKKCNTFFPYNLMIPTYGTNIYTSSIFLGLVIDICDKDDIEIIIQYIYNDSPIMSPIILYEMFYIHERSNIVWEKMNEEIYYRLFICMGLDIYSGIFSEINIIFKQFLDLLCKIKLKNADNLLINDTINYIICKRQKVCELYDNNCSTNIIILRHNIFNYLYPEYNRWILFLCSKNKTTIYSIKGILELIWSFLSRVPCKIKFNSIK